MGFFGKKKTSGVPVVDKDKFEPALRCSICTGEQVFVAVDRQTGAMNELMLIRGPRELDEVCAANGISADEIRRIY